MIRTLICFSLVAALGAQNAPRWGGNQGMGGRPREAMVMARISQMRAERIQQSLGLPPERARAIAERWGRFDLEFLEHQRQLRQIQGRFNAVLMGPGTDAEKDFTLRPLIQQFTNLHRQQMDLRKAFESDVLTPLSPTQQARLVLLVEDMHKNLKEALKGGRGGE